MAMATETTKTVGVKRIKMFHVNIIVFCTLLMCCCANQAQNLGYLFVNGSQPPYCYDLEPNEVCPSNLVSYKILGFNKSTEQVATFELQVVKHALDTLEYFHVTEACRESVRVYSCSNNFAICTPDSKYGVDLKYDFFRTKVACESIKSNCPAMLSDVLTFNCSVIQKDASGYTYCVELPEVQGDVCSKSRYKFPKALGNFYEHTAKFFSENLPNLVKDKLFTNISCEQEFVNIMCELLRGSICSTDMTLRMYAISQQDCAATISKCVKKIPEVQSFYLEVCKQLPDANTAKRVPLPAVASGNLVTN